MARLGCLLIIVAIAGLFAIIVIPVLPPFEKSADVDGYLQPLLCQPGETVLRQQYSRPGNQGGTSFSMDVFCVEANSRRDVTGQWTLIGVGVFLVPFLIGLMSLITGASRSAAKGAAVVTLPGVPMAAQSMTTWAVPASAEKSLAERLTELQQARDQGLITEEEFEKLRQEILDSSA